MATRSGKRPRKVYGTSSKTISSDVPTLDGTPARLVKPPGSVSRFRSGRQSICPDSEIEDELATCPSASSVGKKSLSLGPKAPKRTGTRSNRSGDSDRIPLSSDGPLGRQTREPGSDNQSGVPVSSSSASNAEPSTPGSFFVKRGEGLGLAGMDWTSSNHPSSPTEHSRRGSLDPGHVATQKQNSILPDTLVMKDQPSHTPSGNRGLTLSPPWTQPEVPGADCADDGPDELGHPLFPYVAPTVPGLQATLGTTPASADTSKYAPEMEQSSSQDPIQDTPTKDPIRNTPPACPRKGRSFRKFENVPARSSIKLFPDKPSPGPPEAQNQGSTTPLQPVEVLPSQVSGPAQPVPSSINDDAGVSRRLSAAPGSDSQGSSHFEGSDIFDTLQLINHGTGLAAKEKVAIAQSPFFAIPSSKDRDDAVPEPALEQSDEILFRDQHIPPAKRRKSGKNAASSDEISDQAESGLSVYELFLQSIRVEAANADPTVPIYKDACEQMFNAAESAQRQRHGLMAEWRKEQLVAACEFWRQGATDAERMKEQLSHKLNVEIPARMAALGKWECLEKERDDKWLQRIQDI